MLTGARLMLHRTGTNSAAVHCGRDRVLPASRTTAKDAAARRVSRKHV